MTGTLDDIGCTNVEGKIVLTPLTGTGINCKWQHNRNGLNVSLPITSDTTITWNLTTTATATSVRRRKKVVIQDITARKIPRILSIGNRTPTGKPFEVIIQTTPGPLDNLAPGGRPGYSSTNWGTKGHPTKGTAFGKRGRLEATKFKQAPGY